MGLEQTKGQVWSLFIAIALRQVIVTFSVCLELQHSGVKTFLFLAYLTVLSLLRLSAAQEEGQNCHR